jgi:hypothetical protein
MGLLNIVALTARRRSGFGRELWGVLLGVKIKLFTTFVAKAEKFS